MRNSATKGIIWTVISGNIRELLGRKANSFMMIMTMRMMVL